MADPRHPLRVVPGAAGLQRLGQPRDERRPLALNALQRGRVGAAQVQCHSLAGCVQVGQVRAQAKR